jgi:omega-6 fatty acid desaturase (delta-12 desaturase)
MHPQVFQINEARAWSAVLVSIASMSACLYLISVAPWYLLPFAWALAGTAFTGVSAAAGPRVRAARTRAAPAPHALPGGSRSPPTPPAQFFVVGHDCGHRSFSSNKLLEDIVGTLMFMPLIFPFEPWRIKHNQHHAFTNKLVDDTAWHPVMESEVAKWSPTQQQLYKVRSALGSRAAGGRELARTCAPGRPRLGTSCLWPGSLRSCCCCCSHQQLAG